MDLRAADSGIEFLVGVGAAAGIYSAVHSSLWSARNFGKDPEAAASCRTYSWAAGGLTLAVAAVGSVVSKSIWPFLGAFVFSAFMFFGYRHSLANANGTQAVGGPELGYREG